MRRNKYMLSFYLLFTLCFLHALNNYADDNPFKIAYSVQSYSNIDVSFSVTDTMDISNICGAINGFSLDCEIIRANKNSFVRILLEDTSGRNFLVLENDKYRNNSDTIKYVGYCEETASLNSLTPKYLKIYIKDAIVNIEKIKYSPIATNSPLDYAADMINADTIKKRQVKQIVDNINKYNSENDKFWSAGVTNVSLMNYETKKRVLGIHHDACDTDGIEYYIGGLYEIGEQNDTVESVDTDSVDFAYSCVESFDWRNRHGKNWMTSCKHQGNSGYCSAFAINGAMEALVNLYYNKKIDIDLSEQDIFFTYLREYGNTSVSHYYKHGTSSKVLLFSVRDKGVIDEATSPFIDSDSVSVPLERGNSVECIRFNNFDAVFYYQKLTDRIKQDLINYGPLISGITAGTMHHSMTLVGFHKINVGDTISHVTKEYNGAAVIKEGDWRVGKTYWVFKNSYGEDFGRNGYMYVLFDNNTEMIEPLYIRTPLYSKVYSDDDIICTDNDGDGYYFWGIGNTRPSSLPEWAPRYADGDDSNPKYGPINYGTVGYGSLLEINPDKKDTIFITEETDWDKENYIWQHIVIKNEGILNIKSNVKFYKGVNIIVENGGQLVVDAGYMKNPNIKVEPGGELIIKNKGRIKKNKHLTIAQGAKMRIVNRAINQ